MRKPPAFCRRLFKRRLQEFCVALFNFRFVGWGYAPTAQAAISSMQDIMICIDTKQKIQHIPHRKGIGGGVPPPYMLSCEKLKKKPHK
jgi:hypothetical protein